MSTDVEGQTIHISALMVGEPLPGSLYDERGRLLVTKGRTIDERMLHQLTLLNDGVRDFTLGQDWPRHRPDAPEADPVEVLHQLEDQLGPADVENEKRAHTRHEWRMMLGIDLREQVGNMSFRRQIRASTTDISQGGFGFVFENYMYPGTVVMTCFESLAGTPILRGVVRYCEWVSGMQHRVGVQFGRGAERG